MRVATLGLLAGCGFSANLPSGSPIDAPTDDVIAIDARPDAPGPPGDRDNDTVPDTTDKCPDNADPLQRDHDSDGKGDVCDLCPHINNPADPNADGDEVGDACDPNPNATGELRILFIGFYDEDATTVASWTPRTGTWTVSGGKLRATSAGNYDFITAVASVPRAHVETALDTASLTSNDDAAGVHIGQLGTPPNGITQLYECVVGIASNSGLVQLNALWPTQSVINSFDFWGGALPATLQLVATLANDARCTASIPTKNIMRTTDRDPTAGRVNFVASRATATFDYLFVVDRD